MKTREEIAFELFNTVHDRLGHRSIELHYFDRPCVKQMWIEVARLAIDGVDVCDHCDAYFVAYKLFAAVHAALKDGVDTSLREFSMISPRAEAWAEIAKVIVERQKQAKMLAAHASLDETR